MAIVLFAVSLADLFLHPSLFGRWPYVNVTLPRGRGALFLPTLTHEMRVVTVHVMRIGSSGWTISHLAESPNYGVARQDLKTNLFKQRNKQTKIKTKEANC